MASEGLNLFPTKALPRGKAVNGLGLVSVPLRFLFKTSSTFLLLVGFAVAVVGRCPKAELPVKLLSTLLVAPIFQQLANVLDCNHTGEGPGLLPGRIR